MVQTSWKLLSKLEEEKTVILWRNSVTDTYSRQILLCKKFDISNIDMIEWIIPEQLSDTTDRHQLWWRSDVVNVRYRV